MERIVIHSDLNNFYASVERILNPELCAVPIAVCGNPEERRGIVLAKSEEAKKAGVKTGDTVWQAQKKCAGIVIVKPHFSEYMQYSRKVRAVYARYTDLIENYGIDECWIDVSKSTKIFPAFEEKTVKIKDETFYSDAYLRFLGDTVRNAVNKETGLTVSCGVSFNKVFAKLGSDLKKPNGTSVISKANFKNVIYGLPVEDLLLVGAATRQKLFAMGFNTIGKLALADENFIYKELGKAGVTLLKYARGEDDGTVAHMDAEREYKSIGNSSTYPDNVTRLSTVKRNLYVLSESVAFRLRAAQQGLANTVHLWVRDSEFRSFAFQKKVRHTALCGEIAQHAIDLFCANFKPPYSVRALGISVSGFDNNSSQITFDEQWGDYKKREAVELCVDEIRKKHGYSKIQRGIVAEAPLEMYNDIKSAHIIKPARFDDPETEFKDVEKD